MSQVYFARPRTPYDSYSDLYRLIELSGYPLIHFDEVDPESDNIYILTLLNGENNHGWEGSPRASIVLWDNEWRLKESDYAWSESDLTIPPGVSRVWASDRWYASRINAEYVPLGSHPRLVGETAADGQGWDVAPLSYRSGRRSFLIDRMFERGLSIAPNAWGEERDALLKECKTVLHIHQHDKVPTVAPLRYAIAAAWHKPLISEDVYDRGIFEDSVLYATYDTLTDYTALMVRRYPELLRDKADELHDMLCVSNSFRSYIESAL